VTRTEPTRRTLPAWSLAVGDLAAIVLFAVVGLLNHDEGITAAGIARNTLPILGVWFAIAPFTSVYRRPEFATLLRTWAIAVPAGVAIRAIALHRSADEHQVAFGIVTLIVTGLFLFGWRAIASKILRA
jgi:Protein of unknown function (DUF3054)